MDPTAIAPDMQSRSEAAEEPLTHALRGSAQRHEEAQRSRDVQLTRRQLEVLTLVCEGLPNKLISRRLKISAATVKVHVSVILRALGVSNRLQASISARLLGLADASDRASASGKLQPPDPCAFCKFRSQDAGAQSARIRTPRSR